MRTDLVVRILTRWAGFLSLVASALHGAVTKEHLEEWWGYGLFFILMSIAQFVYALVLFGLPGRVDWATDARWAFLRRRLFAVGIWGNLAIILLYIITRTVGIPLFGPEAGQIEGVGTIDLLSKGVELALIASLATLMALVPRGDASKPQPSTAINP